MDVVRLHIMHAVNDAGAIVHCTLRFIHCVYSTTDEAYTHEYIVTVIRTLVRQPLCRQFSRFDMELLPTSKNLSRCGMNMASTINLERHTHSPSRFFASQRYPV